MAKRDGIQTESSAEGPEQAPSHEKSIYLRKIGRYAITRLPSLVPPMNPAPNPFKALALLNTQQWLFFWVTTRHLSWLMRMQIELTDLGCFLWLDVGLVRFLLRLADHERISRAVRQVCD